MKIDKLKKYLICFLFCFCVVIVSTNVISKTTQQEIDDIKSQQSAAAKQYTQLAEDIAIYEKEVSKLESKVSEYEEQVNNLSKKVQNINNEVEGLESNLQNVASSYETTKDLLNTRMRVLYENGFVNIFEILFTSSNLNDFLTKYSVMVTLIENDKKMLEKMKSEKDYIKSLKEDAELRKLQVEQVEYDVTKTKEALETAKSNKEAKIKQLNTSKQKLAKIQAQLKKDLAAQEEELRRELAAAGSYTGSFTGQFGWPVEGRSIITTYFCETYNPFGTGARKHYWGIDLARSASYTTHIYAIASGKVTTASYSSSGWGNHIVVAHGKGDDGANYVSQYSHLKTMLVKAGDVVYKGQAIGIMGTTGASTGVHLDFIIKRNGTYVNPFNYLTYSANGSTNRDGTTCWAI